MRKRPCYATHVNTLRKLSLATLVFSHIPATRRRRIGLGCTVCKLNCRRRRICPEDTTTYNLDGTNAFDTTTSTTRACPRQDSEAAFAADNKDVESQRHSCIKWSSCTRDDICECYADAQSAYPEKCTGALLDNYTDTMIALRQQLCIDKSQPVPTTCKRDPDVPPSGQETKKDNTLMYVAIAGGGAALLTLIFILLIMLCGNNSDNSDDKKGRTKNKKKIKHKGKGGFVKFDDRGESYNGYNGKGVYDGKGYYGKGSDGAAFHLTHGQGNTSYWNGNVGVAVEGGHGYTPLPQPYGQGVGVGKGAGKSKDRLQAQSASWPLATTPIQADTASWPAASAPGGSWTGQSNLAAHSGLGYSSSVQVEGSTRWVRDRE